MLDEIGTIQEVVRIIGEWRNGNLSEESALEEIANIVDDFEEE